MHKTQHNRLPLLAGLLLIASACSTGSERDITLYETDRGAVYLERISDRSIQAAHPVTISADTMALVLRGVAVKENRGLLGSIVLGKPEAVQVFRDEDVQFLAPLLVEGLIRAASDQKVGFRVVQTGMPWESTTGSLYAYGRSLYLTIPWLIPLSQYGAGGQAPPPTILFFPESAKRPDSYDNARSAESTLVIDYALLASPPADLEIPPPVQIPATRPTDVTEQPAAPAQTTQPIHAPIQSKDREFDDMRKELQDIKRQLAEQNAERNAQKKNGPSKQKTPMIP
ncbi:MAG: hypothetical protein L0H94_03210 [Nitrospira sp.]|nr:hypothetical protein [Nitrospira sp.]